MKKAFILSFLLFIGLKTYAVDTITLGNLGNTNFCAFNSISVPFTSTLPSGTQFTVRLKKANVIINSTIGSSSPISIYMDASKIVYGTDYVIDIVAESISSAESPQLTIGNMGTAFISDGENQQVYFSYESICTGKSKTYFATVKDGNNNIITQNVNFQWKKDGIIISGATNSSFTASEAGSYTFIASSGGCILNSGTVNLSFNSSSISSALKVEGDYFACIGTEKRLQATYISTSATYQWYKDGTAINGASNRVLPATTSGSYTVNIFDGACIGSIGPKQITFSNSLYAPIFASNTDTTICNGSGVQLIGNSSYEFPNQYQYQWQRDGVDIAPEQYYSSTGVGYYARQAGLYNLIYKQGNCVASSRKIQVVTSNLAQKPVITIQNGFDICQGNVKINQTNEANSMMNFASNSGGTIYGGIYGKWFKDGIEIPNSGGTSYTANQPGTYKLQAGYGTCINESNEIVLTFANPILPKIISGNNKTNLCGSNDYVSIYLDTNNLPNNNFTYTWQKDGIPIANQPYNNIGVNSTGVYSLILGNGTCSSISNSITITNSNPFSLVASANNLTCTNQLVKLTASSVVSYINTPLIWKLNNNVIIGETGPTLLTNTAGSYTASINQNGCVATTPPIILNTNEVPIAPNITPITINNGETATLEATGCTGTVNWYNVAAGGTSLFTGSSFTSPALISNTKYYADCSNATCTSILRKSVQVTVIGGVGPIVLGTVSLNSCVNSNLLVPFTTTLPIGTVFTVSLYKAGQLVTTKTGTSSPISILIGSNTIYGTDYIVKITSGSETSLESAAISIGNISSANIDDGLGNSNSPQYLCPGKEKVLYAKIYTNNGYPTTGNGITYQWQKNNIDIADATFSTLLVNAAGTYTVKAFQGGCMVTSYSINVVIDTNIPHYFNNQTELACENTTIDLLAQYYSNSATYQWQKNGVDISGEVNRKLLANSSGLYSVKITDGTCMATSQQTKLTFSTAILASIHSSNGDTTLCGGNTIALFGSAYDNTKFNFSWQKDGIIIPNETNRYYYANQPGVYNLIYKQGDCISKSKDLTIISSNKAQKPNIFGSSFDAICNGNIRLIQNTKYDQLNYNYFYLMGKWYKDGIEIPNINNAEYTATSTGAYKMVYGNGTCAIESNTLNIDIGNGNFTPKIKLNYNYPAPNTCGNNGITLEIDNFASNTTLTNPSYQWRRNGQNIYGATNNYFNIYQSGEYSLFVVNDNCSALSNVITVTDNQVITLTATENNFYCANRAVKISTNLAEYSNKNTVIWKRNEVVIPNETSAYLYATLPGIYTASVNTYGCNAISNPIILDIAIPTTLFTTKSGNWNDPLCWICGQLPNSSTDVKISNSHIINVPTGSHDVKNITLEGTVNFETGGELKMTGN